jgi:uncharacterized membrane protein
MIIKLASLTKDEKFQIRNTLSEEENKMPKALKRALWGGLLTTPIGVVPGAVVGGLSGHFADKKRKAQFKELRRALSNNEMHPEASHILKSYSKEYKKSLKK